MLSLRSSNSPRAIGVSGRRRPGTADLDDARSSSSAKAISNRSAALATLAVVGTDSWSGQPASTAIEVTSASGSPHGSINSKSVKSVVTLSAMP